MNANSAVAEDDRQENPNFIVEVNSIEKQLWRSIHSKGILHPDVRELYEKAGFKYGEIFTADLEHDELQEVEFYLWKLHYKHIDEFRKGFKSNSPSVHMEAFRSFLLRATEFYKNLILKLKKHYGVSEELSGQEIERSSTINGSNEVQKYRFLCHRFYICIGDLARYREQYLKMGDRPNWSASATQYLEAARTWPDSGNPHNQLAVLATYVGDELLALYHCVRSLAVKEPFPGASNNLLLLFEKNRMSPLESMSMDTHFNFLNPSERSFDPINVAKGNDLWAMIVRITSFFFLKSSLDEFAHVLAACIRELDRTLAVDDRNLKLVLESYQLMDLIRKGGPSRFFQIVVIFVFIFHNLTINHGSNEAKEELALGLKMVFIIVGRIVERCSRTSPLDSCPLLPAILIFSEYLPFVLDKAEEFGIDDESEAAISYFFSAFADLLNRLNVKRTNSFHESVALWEDHELRAFAPLATTHSLLDFSIHLHQENELRLHRIRNSGIKVAMILQKSSKNWIFWDEQEACFHTGSGEMQVEEEIVHGNGKSVAAKETGTESDVLDENDHSVSTEEEEVILLKPLARCKSAPPYSSSGDSTKNLGAKTGNQTCAFHYDSLRRTASLISDSSRDEHQETESLQPPCPVLEEGISGRPPSLSAWVVDSDKEKLGGPRKLSGLSPIDETVAVTSFDSLCISNTEDSVTSYSPPTPSAPLLPEDASWAKEAASSTSRSDDVYESGVSINYGLPLPGFMKPYKNPQFVGMSSAEWLRRYRESQNLGSGNYNSGYSYQSRNFLVHESSKFSLLDRYGTPGDHPMMIRSENTLFYPGLDHQMYQECEKTKGYGLGLMRDDRGDDPNPLLPRLRGIFPAYMNH